MRKLLKKRVVPLVGIIASSALVLAGCSAPSSSTSGGATGGKQSVTFWHRTFTPVENEWYAQVVKDFNAAQDKIVVKDQQIPADSWDQKLKAAQAAGNAPDVYTHSGTLNDAVRLGQVAELKGLVSDEALAKINDGGKRVAQIGGKWYAYPLLLEPQTVLFWNKDMFKAAGLDPEVAPKSWDELYRFCETLKPTLKDGQFCISTAEDADTFAWSTVGQQVGVSGHKPVSEDWSKANATDPKYVQLLNFYKTLYDKGYIPKQPLNLYVEASSFGQGKTAMMVSGSWAMSEIGSDYADMVPKTGVAPFVTSTGNPDEVTSTAGNFKWVVDAKSKNKEAAAKFVEWVLGGDAKVLVPFFVKTQFTKAPVRDDVLEEVNKQPEAGKASWSKVVTTQIVPKTVAEPAYPWDISRAFGLAMEKAMMGQATPEAALQEAQGTIQGIIDRENLKDQASTK
ncbi:MAG: sugar ABC transporter substrate-binding protein [Arcanobacterium sp.]|nr:sugar ABC transporter substrate-binding protein [Arcanobacterium sp.]MDY5589154.1 sugar ABC transporter substrate-binding protein [Arcanobacterium sp.]